MFIRHIGTYNSRNSRGSSTLSLHAYAKGIDLAKFIIFNTNGSTTVINNTMKAYSGANGAFYDSFRQCWKDSESLKDVEVKCKAKGENLLIPIENICEK